MHPPEPEAPQRRDAIATAVAARDIVMGLHWAPAAERTRAATQANLDAVCLLLDAHGRPIELVHPGRPLNENGSVMHTGDSPDGASTWDDERVFAFLDALPESVHALQFGVVSVNGHAFGDIAGASCHVSDQSTEGELIKVELTALGRLTQCGVATLQRAGDGWTLSRNAPDVTNLEHLSRSASQA